MKGMAGSDWSVMAVEICGKPGRGGEKRQQSCRTPYETASGLGEDICVEEVVAEFALRIELSG
jgi:hypothetical protein